MCFLLNRDFAPGPEPDYLSIFMRTRAPLLTRASVHTPQADDPWVIDPFLRVTSWHIRLADYLKAPHLRNRLLQLLLLPASNDPSILGPNTLGLVVDRYLKRIVRLTDKAPLGVRCLLMGYPR